MRCIRARLPWLAVLLPGLAHAQPVDAPPGDAPPVVEAPPAVEPAVEPEPDPDPDPDPDKKDKKDKGKKDKDADPAAPEPEKKKKKDERIPEVSGYVQVRYQNPIDTNDDNTVAADSFRLRRVRLKVNGKIKKHIGYSVEFDPLPDADGILRDAYIELTYVPYHEIRIGQQKTQFGRENTTSSTRLYWVNRSAASGALGAGRTLRDIGIGIIGELPLGGGFSIEDAITVVNGAGANVTSDDTEMKNVWGRLGGRYENLAIGLDVRLGVSGGFGDVFDPGADPASPIDDYRYDFRRVGVDFEVDHTWVYVIGEYLWGRDIDQLTGNEIDTSGYYVGAVGKTPWKVGPMVRYDIYTDVFDTDTKRYTLGAYYGRRNAELRAMINYERRVDRDDRLILWGQVKF